MIAELIEVEARGLLGDVHGVSDRLGVIDQKAGHLFRGLEVALGVGFEAVAGGVERAAVADARDHVVQRPPRRDVVQHVVGRDQPAAQVLGQVGVAPQEVAVVVAVGHPGRDVEAPAVEPVAQAPVLVQPVVVDFPRREQQANQSPGVLQEVVQGQVALRLRGPPLAQRKQPAQPGVGVKARRVDHDAQPRRLTQHQAAAHPQRQAHLLRRDVSPHHPGQRVGVGDAQGAVAQLRRSHHQLVRVRRPGQEREVRADAQLGVGGFAAAERDAAFNRAGFGQLQPQGVGHGFRR